MKRLFFPLLIIAIISSCKKQATTYSIAGNAAPTISYPKDAAGMFSETKVITSDDYNLPQTTGACIGKTVTKLLTISNTNNQQMTVSTVGFQISNDTLSIGAVSYNGTSIPRAEDGCIINTYYSLAGPSDSITFPNFTTWAGYIYTLTDSFSYSFTDNLVFPTISDIVSSGTVSTRSSYTLSAYGAVSGDSVMFLITGPNGTIGATSGANATSYTFSAAQMALLGTTGGNKYGLLRIVPYRMASQMINGNKFYVLKETCLSKYVVLD